MARKQLVDHFANRPAFVGQADTNGSTIDLASLVMHKPHLDQFFEVIGHIRSLIISARLQLASGDFVVADVEEKQRLNGVDFENAHPFEFVLGSGMVIPGFDTGVTGMKVGEKKS